MKLVTLYAYVPDETQRVDLIEALQVATDRIDISFIQYPPREKV